MNQVIFNGQEISPSKVVCIGRNYVEHIHELSNEMPDEMVVFNKPNSAVTTELAAFHHEPLHYETEICFIVQQGELAGVAVGLDLTKRNLQSKLKSKGLPWERAKSFDGSALFSEFVLFDGKLEGLRIECDINSELRQAGGVTQMIFQPNMMLSELTQFMSLADGDIIMTGTPKGVGQVNRGDVFHCRLYRDDTLLQSVEWLAK